VKQLAESVEAHDAMLTGIFSAAEPSAYDEPGPELPVAFPPDPAAALTASPVLNPAEAAPPVTPAFNIGFKGLGPAAKVAAIREAVEANRIDLYLQPVVTLPQRKVRFYEALTRLRTAGGEQVLAEDFMPHAEAAGLMPKIDNVLVFRCVQILRRLLVKNRDIGLFCNVSGSTLGDLELFAQFSDFMEANRTIAPALIFEFKQPAYRAMGPIEYENLASLARQGFRFSMDHVTDMRMEPRELSERGFRYLKVPGVMLLTGTMVATGDIHSADLSDLLARYHIDLIAERIESETSVVDLLDFDVRFGQGFLFSQPRPVRAEAMEANGSNDDSRAFEKGVQSRRGIGEPGVPRLATSLGVVA
jgi:cyclic-di-GMP phosphodiesterase TipF (flagellum assembly factor)